MWNWLESLLYGTSTQQIIAVPPTEAIAEQQALADARGRTSLIFDSHIMTESASSKNPQAVSLAWDEGRAYGFNVAPQSWMGMTPRERKETLLSIFLANPWASNCIDTIARYITSGGFTIEPRVENPDERQRLEIEAFLKRINEDWDFNQYVYDQITDEDIFGECFTEFTMKDGKPYQLFPIDNLTMDTEHDKYGRVTRYKQQLTSTSIVNFLDPKTIIRWWNPHKRAKVDPLSPLERIQDAILLDKKMVNWMTTFFQKGAKFNYYFRGLGDQDEADRFLTYYRANFTGEKNAQTPPVLWGNAEIAPLGNAGPLDMDFDKGLDRMLTIVLSAFHVPPSIACIAEAGNRLTDMSDGQRKILQYIACDPRRHQFFEKFNYRLIEPFWSDYYVSSRYADFRDDESLSKVQDTRIRNGSATINEVRQESGKDAYEKGGDVPVIVVTRDVIPLERLDEVTDEQRQAAQITERQAKANADLAEIKVQQAKEPQLTPPDGKNGAKSGDNQGNAEKSDRETKNESLSQHIAAHLIEQVVQQQTGMMLAFMLDPETAQQLAIPGGEPASELHITLAYLGDMEDQSDDDLLRPHTSPEKIKEAIASIANDVTPIAGEIGGIGRFYPAETEETPIIALVDVPGLVELRIKFVNWIRQCGYFVAENHGYTPHITLAYIDKGAPSPIETVPPLALCFDTVWLCIGDERIPFKLGEPVVPPPTGDDNAEQETHTQSNETDDVRPGQDQSESDGEVHQTQEVVDRDGSELDRGRNFAEGESDSVADQQKAELAGWVTDLFQAMKTRGASLDPTAVTAASIYTFSDQEQGELARKLAEINVAAQRFAYSRDMQAVGLTPQIEESLFSKVGDLITWGREQVGSIVGTMREMLSNFISNLKGDANIAEQIAGWIDRYADYKPEQIANVTWGTGANDGSMQAIEDILDVATDPKSTKQVLTDSIRIRVVPAYSSSDACADYAGKDYSMSEYLQLGIGWPAHPNCRHSIEVFRKDDGEA